MSEPRTTDRLSCECCDWAGGEVDLKPDHTCPKCGEVVWSDQVILGRTLDDWRFNVPHVGMGNDEALALIDEIERLRKALAFARSVIKSGEPWTETCEQELRL